MSGVASLTCWGISQPSPAMKMLLLKQCMRNSITLCHGRRVFWTAQVGVSAYPPGTSGCHLPLAVCIFSASAAPRSDPDSQSQLIQSDRMVCQSPESPSICVHCMNQAWSFSTLTLVPWLWGGSFCVLCDVCLHIRLPVRW